MWVGWHSDNMAIIILSLTVCGTYIVHTRTYVYVSHCTLYIANVLRCTKTGKTPLEVVKENEKKKWDIIILERWHIPFDVQK